MLSPMIAQPRGRRIKPRPNSAAATIPRFFSLSIDSRPTFVILNARISTIYRRREDEEEKKRRRVQYMDFSLLRIERKITAERQKCTHWKIDGGIISRCCKFVILSFFFFYVYNSRKRVTVDFDSMQFYFCALMRLQFSIPQRSVQRRGESYVLIYGIQFEIQL